MLGLVERCWCVAVRCALRTPIRKRPSVTPNRKRQGRAAVGPCWLWRVGAWLQGTSSTELVGAGNGRAAAAERPADNEAKGKHHQLRVLLCGVGEAQEGPPACKGRAGVEQEEAEAPQQRWQTPRRGKEERAAPRGSSRCANGHNSGLCACVLRPPARLRLLPCALLPGGPAPGAVQAINRLHMEDVVKARGTGGAAAPAGSARAFRFNSKR